MATKDLSYGVVTIRRILQELEAPAEFANLYAKAILAQAIRNAAARPTPQAPMAARNLDVQGDSIGPSAGGAPAAVAIGSEFGSAIYPQFQKPPRRQGYWLYPAAEATETLAAGDEALEALLQGAIAHG